MKITILSPYIKIAGGVIILVNYAHYLSLLGHDVTMVVISGAKWRRRVANFLRYKPSWTKGLNIKIKRIPKIEEQCMPNADILFVSASSYAKTVEKFSDKKGEKVYLVQHDERMYHESPELVTDTYRLPYKFAAVSTWLKEMLKRDFDKDAELLINPINRKVFYPREKEDSGEIRILMLHHTYEWKGAKEGMKIVKELKEKYKNIKLIMYGARADGVECDEYHYKPFGEKLGKLHASCDIFLCPSWDEGFGLHPLEAMASGVAVATYDSGGPRDFAIDGETALVAERKNEKQLKEKLEILIKDKELREKIAKQGREYFNRMPTWEEQAKKLEKIFLNICQK